MTFKKAENYHLPFKAQKLSRVNNFLAQCINKHATSTNSRFHWYHNNHIVKLISKTINQIILSRPRIHAKEQMNLHRRHHQALLHH
jgi:hypothetical protein